MNVCVLATRVLNVLKYLNSELFIELVIFSYILSL